MSQDENRVTVEVKVSIPLGATPARAGSGSGFPQLLLTTTRPREGIPAFVRVDATTGKKYICAEGTAVQANVPALFVCAKVFSGFHTVSEHPTPPDGTWGVVPQQTGNPGQFSFSQDLELPGADCGTAASPLPNTLFLWAYYPSSGANPETAVIHFPGVCSAQTDCGRSAGSDHPLALAAAPAQALPDRLTASIPRKSGAFAALPDKGEFTRDPHQGVWSWSRSGDGLPLQLCPAQDGLRLYCPGADPVLISPQPRGSLHPVHLVFEAVGRHGHFTLVLTE